LNQETVIHVFWERVEQTPHRPAILHKVAGEYRPVVWGECGRIVSWIAAGLLKHGVKSGDKVAILSNSRSQWSWADIAILSIRGVTVPIYPTLTANEIDYLLKHAEASAIFCENSRQLAKVIAAGEKLSEDLRFAVLMEGEVPEDCPIKALTWEEFLQEGNAYFEQHGDAVGKRLEAIKPDDIATIVYTSGTTGIPKGVMLSHRNIYFVCQTISLNVGFHPDDVALSFLPLSHIFERVGGQFLCIYEGMLMGYAEGMETVPQNMMEVRPTIMNAVPRFYEKAFNRITAEVRKMPQAQQYLVRWALSLGKRAAKFKEQSAENELDIVHNIYKTELRVADRLVFSRIRRRFGGRLRFLVSGAAPLSPEVQTFFECIGLPILEGYGLTETAAPVACNKPNDIRKGSVGKPLPGLEVKIAEDGEILVKGPSVFAGYYKDKNATAEALKDGWFKTGDIGELDADGYLRIKDRKKDIIITSGGKHVAPQFIENLFAGERIISRVLVYGDKRRFITALITLNPDGLHQFANQHGISFSSVEELANHPLVLQEVQIIVTRKNERLASFEQIKKYVVLETEFSIESDELTPTLKMKRKFIIEKYHRQLDELYIETEEEPRRDAAAS
jgi:long-chain acyl-CoA synthetase